MKYKITIESFTPYKITSTHYEGTDGKVYDSSYGLPEGVKVGRKEIETGEIGYSKREIFTQEQEDLELVEVIKAINKI